MAKKSMINKQQRPQKFKVREYTRCERCGRPHSVLRKYKLCRICFRELAYKGQIPGVKKASCEGGILHMIMTYPIADMLTRIRNAFQQKHASVSMPASNEKKAIAQILKNEGFIVDFNVEGDVKKTLNIELKYGPNNEKVISGLRRISKPGLRVYAKVENLPSVLNGLGIAIISTSNGMMTDKEARKNHLGGEVIAYVW